MLYWALAFEGLNPSSLCEEEVRNKGSELLDGCISFKGELDDELERFLQREINELSTDIDLFWAGVEEMGGWSNLPSNVDGDTRIELQSALARLKRDLGGPE